MKIVSIQTALLRAPLKKPFKTALRSVNTLEDMIVIITCDDGSKGYGEAAPTPAITGETIGSIKGAITHITPLLVGQNIDDISTLLETIHNSIVGNTTTKSALEMALYDLVAKQETLPLFQYLGGKETTFQSDITISLNPIDIMIQDSLDAINDGYKILKIKLGKKESLTTIAEISKTIGTQAILRLDANQAWSPKECVEIMNKIEDMGITAQFIEQPVAAHDLNGLKYIKTHIQTPLLADESLFSPAQALYILENNIADYLNIKLAKCGGISKGLEIADIARQFGAKCMIGCMLEGPVGIAAALHLTSAASDVITMVDLDAVSLLRNLPCDTTAKLQGDRLKLSEAFGIGVSPFYGQID